MENGHGGPEDFLVVDRAAKVGGCATSATTDEGFTFDYGGHVLFPHKHFVRFAQLLRSLPLEWSSSVPERGVVMEGRFLPYPAQRNLHRLPYRKLARALSSAVLQRFRAAEPREVTADPDNGHLDDFLHEQFGPYLSRVLMRPLNHKHWAHAPNQLNDSWVRHRSGSSVPNVASMEIVRTVRNFISQRDDPGWTSDTQVAYPAHGGSGAIWSAVGSLLPPEQLLLETDVTSICLARKEALLSNGEIVHWEHLVSSMPLDNLLLSMIDRPDLQNKAGRFVRARSRLFGFGVRGPLPEQYAGLHSCQLVDADIPFWRINFPMSVAPGNGPEGSFSMLCEVSEPADKPPVSVARLRRQVQGSLMRLGLICQKGQKVVSRWELSLEHGYPVPFRGRDALLAEIHPELKAASIYSRGRFGSWRYEISNQDHAYMQGVEAARHILFGEPEQTHSSPVEIPETPEQKIPARWSYPTPVQVR